MITQMEFYKLCVKFNDEFEARKRSRKYRMCSLFLALKFMSLTRRREKQFGKTFQKRFKNFVRRKFTFAVSSCTESLAERAKKIFT